MVEETTGLDSVVITNNETFDIDGGLSQSSKMDESGGGVISSVLQRRDEFERYRGVR